MTTPRIVHKCTFLDTICLFINDITFIWKNWSNIIFFFLTTDKKDFVLGLNRSKFLWKNISISNRNFYCCLGIQLMNEKRFLLLVVVMKTRFYTSQDIIRFKTNNIMQESSKFINFTFDFNNWSSIFLHKINMITNFGFKFSIFRFKFLNKMFLLKYFEVLLALIMILKFRYFVAYSLLKRS